MKKRILVVDDEKKVTIFLRSFLEDTGHYTVMTENKGLAAVATARKFKPDLILLDIMMGDISGDSLADEIKNDPELHRIPIIFLTGIVTKEEVQDNGGVIGGYAYIAKPILAMHELIDCIEANLIK